MYAYAYLLPTLIHTQNVTYGYYLFHNRYIDAVKPGTYGVPKPFYFVFLPSYWCSSVARRPIKVDKDNINIYCIFCC